MFHKRRMILVDAIRIMNEEPDGLGHVEIKSESQRWRYAINLAKVRYKNMNKNKDFDRYEGLPDPGPLHWEDRREDGRFLGTLLNELLSLRKGYTRNLWMHRSLRLIILVVSAAVPVMAILQLPRWVLAVVSSIVVIAEGVAQLFRYQERALLQMRLFGQMRREMDAYLGGSSAYRDNETAFQDFVEAVTAIKTKIDDGMIETLSQPGGNATPDSNKKQA
jgi:Protein of unknown function (DUF4231)